jgi:predicted nucleic acid-binding protein
MTRARILSPKTTDEAISEFDVWRTSTCETSQTTSADVVAAIGLVRQPGLAFHASDAVNVAIARRLGASLLTFDKKLASNARRLGLPVV